MITSEVIAQYISRMLVLDPYAISQLMQMRVTVNENLKAHCGALTQDVVFTLTVRPEGGELRVFQLGVLGVINGILAMEGLRLEALYTAEVPNMVSGFRLVPNTPEARMTYQHITNGLDHIRNERKRQVLDLGFDAANDDVRTNQELLLAALSYAMAETRDPGLQKMVQDVWPFEAEELELDDDAIVNLKKAGALIAAEIDRLTRLRARNLPPEDITDKQTPPDTNANPTP